MDAYLVHYGVKGMHKGVRRTSITYTGESEPIRKRETRAKRKHRRDNHRSGVFAYRDRSARGRSMRGKQKHLKMRLGILNSEVSK